MKNKEKMNNKGFSLVELIIVIAIMVILVGVLAPVYTRYVESSRKSTDVDAMANVVTAMETTLINYAARTSLATSDIIKCTITAGVISFDTTNADSDIKAMNQEVSDIIGNYTLKGSWTTDNNGSLEAHWDGAGVVYVEDTAGVVHEMCGYSDALDNRIN